MNAKPSEDGVERLKHNPQFYSGHGQQQHMLRVEILEISK
jgi:hypothetical protein